ncbi:MAG: hypothetical protein Q7U97_01780, partial [Rhodocyclaceae bacterium]|nr:hypothetical protein [Rhodocyclaceae bacterium]
NRRPTSADFQPNRAMPVCGQYQSWRQLKTFWVERQMTHTEADCQFNKPSGKRAGHKLSFDG